MSVQPVVVLTEAIAPDAMRTLAETCDVRIAAHPTGDAARAALADADAVIVRSTPFGADLIDAAPRLRVIGRHGAGTENIDADAASLRGIPIVNTPGANADSVAEFTVMTTLMALRRVLPVRDDFLAGSLGDGSLPGALSRSGRIGSMLARRRVGVVGFGAIGRRVAALCEAFGAEVTFADPYGPQDDPRARDLATLVAGSDVLTLHTPVTPETRGFLNAALLASAPRGLVVVNAARAEVVDADAMLAALDSGQVASYAVDVWDPEPPRSDDPLLRHPSVIATPHMAAITHDALAAMSAEVAARVLHTLKETS